MGKTSVLKRHHKEFLELVLKEPYLKARERDFVDLYFILKNENWNLKKLIILAKTKFDWHIDPIQLGQSFTQIVALKDVPNMLVPFDRKEMEDFYLMQSKKLQTDIFF